MKNTVLIVEDDVDVLELLTGTFKKAGEFDILTTEDGAEAIRLARVEKPNVVLLDLMLPGMTGFEVCRVLRSEASTKSLPILMITAKADEYDRINGFELGADDYIVKPFSPREILLRVRAVLRRSEAVPAVEAAIESGPISLDRTRHAVLLEGKPVNLTTTEFRLLTALMESRGRVLGRGRLLNLAWGYESAFNTRTVDTHIRRLRMKLGSFGGQIQTIRGFGYRIQER